MSEATAEAPKGDSIHPRARLGGPKLNTCSAKSKATVQRVFAGISGHVERHPRDGMAAARLSVVRGRL